MSLRRILPFLLGSSLAACSSSNDGPGPQLPKPSTTPTEGPSPQPNACPPLGGGPHGTRDPLVDFARAAGAYRFFGPGSDTAPGEAALSRSLASGIGITDATLTAFATNLDGVCTRSAETRSLPAARVEQQGTTAVIHPGSGDIVLAPDTERVTIDLRNVPQSPELLPALERVFAIASAKSVALLDVRSRECNGQPDEVYAVETHGTNVYACDTAVAPGRKLGASAAADLPMTILVSDVIAPDAALFAVSLRARRRAWLVGGDLPITTAESDWYGVGESGLYLRTRTLLLDGNPVPDVVLADAATDGAIPALGGAAKRPDFPARTMPTKLRAATNDPGDGRAALALAYATIRTFSPYVEELAAPIDARFLESMQQLETEAPTRGRSAVTRALGRFTEAISDGHVTLGDFGAKGSGQYAPIDVVALGPDIVVATSDTPDLPPGTTILSIDGEPTGDVLTRIGRLVSCSPHEKPSFASRYLLNGQASWNLHVRDIGGGERDLVLASRKSPVANSEFGMWDRAPGALVDLGASDVYYVSLDGYGAYPPNKVDLAALDAGLAAARAVVLDMRGYPDAGAWKILSRIIPATSHGPALSMLDVTAAQTIVQPPQLQELADFGGGPLGNSFHGPVVLLVGHDTQSSAEHLTSFFKDSGRGKVIGVQTSGANGNITGIQLPGGFGITFTGMHVAHQDGSRFFGIGHIPDMIVEPTPTDLSTHHDIVLEKAITALAP